MKTVEAGGPPWLHGEFETNLSCVRLSKKKNEQQQVKCTFSKVENSEVFCTGTLTQQAIEERQLLTASLVTVPG